MTYEVTVLKPGFLKRDRFGNILDARSTVTLIMGNDLNIIVDTGTAQEKQVVINSLKANGLTPGDINILVNTHSHQDHSGNNDIFNNAKFIGHRKEYWGLIAQDQCEILRKNTEIAPKINVFETPGHTVGSIIVSLEGKISNLSTSTIAITGDALPIMDNYLKWVPPGINFDPNVALQSMKTIVAMAEVIIPGHDAAFKILDRNQRKAEYI